MLTNFGRLCKRIRFDADEVLGDMAERLEVTSSFLSAIMHGKKNVPESLCHKIKEEYHLSEADYEELLQAAETSQTQIKIKMHGKSDADRDLILSFARGIEEMREEDKKKIMEILRG